MGVALEFQLIDSDFSLIRQAGAGRLHKLHIPAKCEFSHFSKPIDSLIRRGVGDTLMQERWNSILVLAADKDHDKTGGNGKKNLSNVGGLEGYSCSSWWPRIQVWPSMRPRPRRLVTYLFQESFL
jgi:hypothetical protein